MKKMFWNKFKVRSAAAVLAAALAFSMSAPLALAAQPEEAAASAGTVQEADMPTLQPETPELAAEDPEAPPVQATEAEENSTNQHTPENSVVLTPDCRDVFSIAKASGADFVRITAFVDTLHFPVGTVQPCAVQAWEVRREGNMQDISILADIQVKHAELVYPQTTLEQSAYLAQAQGADAIVVTGNATGEETPMETIRRVAKVSKIPIVVGSGLPKLG